MLQTRCALTNTVKQAGKRFKVDNRNHVRSGAKYFERKSKDVPLRASWDVDNGSCVFKYRLCENDKITMLLDNPTVEAVSGLKQTRPYLHDAVAEQLELGVTSFATYKKTGFVLKKNEPKVYPDMGLFLVPQKCNAFNKDKVKKECKATVQRCFLEENKEFIVKGSLPLLEPVPSDG